MATRNARCVSSCASWGSLRHKNRPTTFFSKLSADQEQGGNSGIEHDGKRMCRCPSGEGLTPAPSQRTCLLSHHRRAPPPPAVAAGSWCGELRRNPGWQLPSGGLRPLLRRSWTPRRPSPGSPRFAARLCPSRVPPAAGFRAYGSGVRMQLRV